MAHSFPFAPLAELPLNAEESTRAGRIDFTTDREAELPVGVQLVWKIRGMAASGALRPGDRLPGVRDLAEFSDVNVNTARSAYATLEVEGLLRSEQGRGTFVAARATELRGLETIVARAIEDSIEAGLDPLDLPSAIYALNQASSEAELPPDPFPAVDPSEDSAAMRRDLREQIERIERELAIYAWDDPLQPAPKGPATAVPVGRVADVATLERIRGQMINRLARLRGDVERRGASEQRARTRVEGMIVEPSAHRWEVVTSEQAGEPGCKSWRVVPRFGPFGAVMGWWRVKVSSGCPAAGPLAAASGGVER